MVILHFFLFSTRELLSGSLNDGGQALRTLFCTICNRVVHGNELEYSLHSFVKKFSIHILRSAGKEEVQFYSVPFLEPLTDLFCFKLEIVFTSCGFDLDCFCFYDVSASFLLLLLLLLIVLKLTIISYFCNRRIGVWRYFNEVEILFPSKFHCFAKWQSTKVFTIFSNDL